MKIRFKIMRDENTKTVELWAGEVCNKNTLKENCRV